MRVFNLPFFIFLTTVLTFVLPKNLQAAGFIQSAFVGGLNIPTSMAFAPDGRLFATEKGGELRVIKNGQLLNIPFLTVSVNTGHNERGLLGVAFDPKFSSNSYVYVYYTRANEPIKNRLSRFTASLSNPDVAELGSEVVILDDIASDRGNHNGGGIHFGPDGKLYIGVGDGGRNSQNSQTLSNLSGKLLRIDLAKFPNIIPTDNPFVGTPGARGEIWALGLRNPFTFAIDPAGGKIYINDVGLNNWEEINEGKKGANYGWPVCEGSCNPPNSNFTDPTYEYAHNGKSAAITGGTFYRGGQFPSEYYGSYFFGDFLLGFIKLLNTQGQVSDFRNDTPGVVDIDVGPDGALYWLSIFQNSVYKIDYTNGGGNLLKGDLDKDGDVDIFDYNLMIENFGNTHCGNVADINSDCKVDIFDYNILVENFGKKA